MKTHPLRDPPDVPQRNTPDELGRRSGQKADAVGNTRGQDVVSDPLYFGRTRGVFRLSEGPGSELPAQRRSLLDARTKLLTEK